MQDDVQTKRNIFSTTDIHKQTWDESLGNPESLALMVILYANVSCLSSFLAVIIIPLSLLILKSPVYAISNHNSINSKEKNAQER